MELRYLLYIEKMAVEHRNMSAMILLPNTSSYECTSFASSLNKPDRGVGKVFPFLMTVPMAAIFSVSPSGATYPPCYQYRLSPEVNFVSRILLHMMSLCKSFAASAPSAIRKVAWIM